MRPFLTLALIAPLFLSVAAASDDLRPAGRFDDRILHREGGAIAVAQRGLDQLQPSDELRAGWERFDSRHGGQWRVYLDERTAMPTMVAGRGIEWLPKENRAGAGLADHEARALAFLAEHQPLLGNWTDFLELDLDASGKMREGYWQLVFRQVVDGVRVENARLEFHVNSGRLVLFGSSHWGLPSINGVPKIDADAARAALDAHLQTETKSYEQAAEPELVILAVDADPTASSAQSAWTGARGEGVGHSLVWRLRFRDPDSPAKWVGEVDAHDGTVRAFYDATAYASVRGGVFPISNDLDCADGGCEIAGFPMPYVDFTETGQAEDLTDAYGNLTCGEPTASFETNLSGRHVNIVDSCGMTSELGSCEDGIELGLKSGENCDAWPDGMPGNSAAARSSYYHLTRASELALFYDPDNPWLVSPVNVNVNFNGSCNAFWDGEITMLGAGNGCGNTGEQRGVTVHEWGHGYDYNDGGGSDKPSEAYADIVAMFSTRHSCMSRGWYNDGRTCTGYGDACLTCTGIRDHDYAARELNTPRDIGWLQTGCDQDSSPFSGPCRREAHCEAYVTGEAMYDLVARDLPAMGVDDDTAWQLAERLWYETRPGSGGDAYFCYQATIANSCGANSWYQKMRVADDDDGDLANGTPHAAALYAAFARHGLACGAVGDPDNQNSSSCPTLAAPNLSIVEIAGGTQLSWSAVAGAAEYRVYRGELGCNRQQIPLASLTGGETSYLDTVTDPTLPRDYRIEAFGSTPACHSPVSNCEATPPAARLQKNEHRFIEPGPTTNGRPDPGETVQMATTLFNVGVQPATTVTGQLRFADPAQGTVSDADATWADIVPTATVESDDPHFELTVAESVSCGETVTLELDSQAANATMTTHAIDVRLGDKSRDFVIPWYINIPEETIEPATGTIVVDEDDTLTELDISIDIYHTVPTELIVEFSSPEGTTVRLHDQTAGTSSTRIVRRYDLGAAPDGPGTMSDFVGESTLGTWTVSIHDVGTESVGVGKLNNWALHMTVEGAFDCEDAACSEPAPDEVPELRVDASLNGPALDLVFSWDPVTAAGYNVWQSTAPTFDTAVEQVETTTTETTLTLDDGANTTPDLTYFLVRAVNSCGLEGL